MIVAILQVEIGLFDAVSLKDKRRVIRSLKDRLHREHQVSVSEVGTQEDPTTATLGIVMAGSDVKPCQSTMGRILDKIASGRGVRGGGYTLDHHDLRIIQSD